MKAAPGRPVVSWKPKHPAVEIERALQVGDLQVHMADAHPRVDGRQLQGLFFERFGLTWGISLAGRPRPDAHM